MYKLVKKLLLNKNVIKILYFYFYRYYGLAAFGPHMQKYLWWKRYITQIQIVQFLVLIVHGIYFALCNTGYPLINTLDVLIQPTLYVFLFTRFYLSTYKRKDI